MRKFVELSLVVENLKVEGQSFLKVNVSNEVLRDWALSLELLHERLVEAMVFPCCGSFTGIELKIADGNESEFRENKGRLIISLSAQALDFVRHFFLRYYRDEVAEVDHIDIENSDGGYITFFVDRFQPPVSANEVKRRLGIDG